MGRPSPHRALGPPAPSTDGRDEILAFHPTAGASNRPTEAVNLIIEHVRRLDHGYRNFTNCRRRILFGCGITSDAVPTRRIRGRQPASAASSPISAAWNPSLTTLGRHLVRVRARYRQSRRSICDAFFSRWRSPSPRTRTWNWSNDPLFGIQEGAGAWPPTRQPRPAPSPGSSCSDECGPISLKLHAGNGWFPAGRRVAAGHRLRHGLVVVVVVAGLVVVVGGEG